MLVYAVVSEKLSPTSPLGDAVETFVRREDAERFVEESSSSFACTWTGVSRGSTSLMFANDQRWSPCSP